MDVALPGMSAISLNSAYIYFLRNAEVQQRAIDRNAVVCLREDVVPIGRGTAATHAISTLHRSHCGRRCLCVSGPTNLQRVYAFNPLHGCCIITDHQLGFPLFLVWRVSHR